MLIRLLWGREYTSLLNVRSFGQGVSDRPTDPPIIRKRAAQRLDHTFQRESVKMTQPPAAGVLSARSGVVKARPVQGIRADHMENNA